MPGTRQRPGWSAHVLLILAARSVTGAALPEGATVSFLACPIAQDTGAHTDLCFFAEHDGAAYSLANPPDWGEPQLEHQVLVEGHVVKHPSACGELRIEGRVSVMPERDPACNEVRPYVAHVRAADNANAASKLEKPRDPSQSLAPQMLQVPPAPPVDPKTRGPATCIIYFPFDSERGPGPDMAEIKEFAKYAIATHARKLTVEGASGGAKLMDAPPLAEDPELGERRAAKIAGILVALGVPQRSVQVSTRPPVAGTGIDDWRHRKVTVKVYR